MHINPKNKRILLFIVILFITTRFILSLIGVSSRTVYEDITQSTVRPSPLSTQAWLDIWGQWDTYWYLTIAEHGYNPVIKNEKDETETLGQANYGFFPLYPLMARLLSFITGSAFLAGLIISNVCILLGAFFLYKLVRLEDDEETAIRTVKYLFLFPTAFIFSAMFTESLFFLLSILAFYFAKQKKWWLTGICGCLLTLTRSVGILIILPLLFEYGKSIHGIWREIKLSHVLSFMLIPMGIVSFSIYNFYLTGDYLGFVHIQQNGWGRILTNPAYDILMSLTTHHIYEFFLAIFAIAAIMVIIRYQKKISVPYLLYTLLLVGIPLSSGLGSAPRYLLVVFPLYIIFARIGKNKTADEMMTIGFALLQGFFMAYWALGTKLII